MAYDFKYIRTGTGELSGPSMIWQTEQALTQIGTYADEASTKADEALDTANTALNKANEAAEAAERAQNTADAAQAAANHAQETADAAQVAADNAQDTADEALETAQKGVADAAKAQAAADKAQATADAAQDAADAAQLTADNAQNAADKAQDAADAAQQTANDALNTASNSQGSANVAQDTADNALLVAQSTQQAFYEHVREYTSQIAKALGEFEADNTTVNFDNFTDSVKLYITSPDASITGPNGKVNSPFYLWNFTTDDRSSTAQFVYAANGLTYSRYGTIGQNDLVPGTNTYTLENNSKNAILTCNGVASGMTITKSGSLTNTWTASDTHNSYITGTWNIKGITNGTIDLNGVTIANLSDTGFYPTGQQLQEDNASFVIEDMTYSADDGLTIKVTVQWLNIDSQISWDSWKVDAPAVDTSAVDNVTIKYNSSNELQAKDVAIGGNLEDLASARGQIGDSIRINTASDLNAYTKAGNWLFSDAAAGENFPNVGRGGELNCYVSTTAIFQFFTEFNNNRRYIRYGIPDSTWTNWIQFISVAQLGDGIRTTQGIISVPEYEGATVSAAGTSGLVPPAAAGQRESFLTGGGEYKPALTKISDSVSLANSTTAASAKAVKTVYDLANGKQAALGFTPVQQGGGTGQGTNKVYIGWATDASGLKAQADNTDLGNIVTTKAGTIKAPQAALADHAQVANTSKALEVTGWGPTTWTSTEYTQSPLYLWCLPTGGSAMMPCSPSVLSAGAANWCVYTPNVAVGDNSAVPQGGTWKYFSWGYERADSGVVAGGTNVPNRFIAIRVS